MPDTWPGITFDSLGVCNLCRAHDAKQKINWEQRQRDFGELLDGFKAFAKENGLKYDCLVGYSGGKDSTYTLWAMKRKYGMTPLAVTFDHGFTLGEEARYNLVEVPKLLDVDHLTFTVGGNFRNALCKAGSEFNGDFCWHCHNGVGALPARISAQWGIPLQIWGEPTAEYGTNGAGYTVNEIEEQDEEHFEKTFQGGATPEKLLPPGYEMRDMVPFMWPWGVGGAKGFPLKALYLGNFEPWNQREQVEIITKELGWKHHSLEGSYVDWDKVDCPYEPVRDWQKFQKRGFGRTTFQASKDVRDGLITRLKALELVGELDGKRPKALDAFLKETNISEEEFARLTKQHIVYS
jgi:N-acetyl sugar amidotransferase